MIGSRVGEAARTWGSTAEERALEFPCDRELPGADDALFRAVTIVAPAAVAFRWLCQLRAAPYSYDWIDNLGRRSPRRLIPGLERLEEGQPVMTIFDLASFQPDRQITVRLRRARRAFGDLAGTYLLVPASPGACRLVVKLRWSYPRGILGPAARRLLPLGDMVMMRRQLLNLKRLAEQQAAESEVG